MLRTNLQALGLERGEALFLHSSLSGIDRVVAGVSAAVDAKAI